MRDQYAITTQSQPRIIPISELQPGMYVTHIVEQHGPVKIRKQGHITSDDMVKGLTEMGVSTLAIDPAQGLDIDTSVTPHAPSPTQSLLQQSQARQMDNDMSEQFNRSIFLPSIQRMPSAWVHTLRTTSRYILVGIVGGGFGFVSTYGYFQLSQPAHTAHVSEAEIPVTADMQDEPPTPVADVSPALTPPLTPVQTPALTPTKQATQPADPPVENHVDTQPVDVAETERAAETEPAPETVTASPELRARVAEALAALEERPENTRSNIVKVTSSADLPKIGQLPARMLTQMPSMVFAQHMYSSEFEDRWVRVNNRRLQEGDMIAGRVKIEAIHPQYVELSLDGTRFTMDALTDW